MDTPYILVQVSVGSLDEARTIARSVVEQRFVACAQMLPIRSCYEWEGTIEEDEEYLLLMKTRADVYQRLEQHLCSLHSYDVPEILALPVVAGLPDYLTWIDSVVAR